MQTVGRKLRNTFLSATSSIREHLTTQAALRQEYQRVKRSLQILTPDNPAAYGYKIYSQCDEDGIIANIFSRIGEGGRTFIEIGCSDGLENNTHALVLSGWRGAWVDANRKKIRFLKNVIQDSPRLIIALASVSPENVSDMVTSLMNRLAIDELDFLSLDIDSLDLHVLRAMLTVVKPRVLCVEYNAKFPPPLEISVILKNRYWAGDDYQGASLGSFVRALESQAYVLVACNLSGVNAFFVRTPEAVKFPSFTPEQLYQPARYDLRRLHSGHRASLKFLRDALSDP